jgi:formyltetrahydrofolate hydrolase
MILQEMKDTNKFNQKLFSMSIEDLNNTKDLIADIIQSKIKSVMKVGMKVNVVQKTKKTSGVITKIMQSKCLVDLNGRIYRVPMSMLEVA